MLSTNTKDTRVRAADKISYQSLCPHPTTRIISIIGALIATHQVGAGTYPFAIPCSGFSSLPLHDIFDN